MYIVIKEDNGFTNPMTIVIKHDSVTIEEDEKIKVLKYNKDQIKKIMEGFLNVFKSWHSKYIGKSVLNNDIYTITIVTTKTIEYYIENKYPDNWENFIMLKNHLIKETLKV